ncbi:MAG: hypothetical protein AB1714_11770 [Acidobacteriota bacterium]
MIGRMIWKIRLCPEVMWTVMLGALATLIMMEHGRAEERPGGADGATLSAAVTDACACLA